MKTALLVVVMLVSPIQAWAQQEMTQALTAQRAAKPTPMSKAQLSDMLNRAASQVPGWAMLRKDGGSNCPTPYPGVSISCDWLFNVATQYGWDFIVDAENAAVIQIGNSGPLQAGQELVMPWPTDAPQPTPTPTPGPNPSAPATKLDLQIHEDNIVQRTQNIAGDLKETIERMFGCRHDGKDQWGDPCATAQDNAHAIRGIALQVKEHDGKINDFVEFLKKPATLSAIITAITTIITLKQTGN